MSPVFAWGFLTTGPPVVFLGTSWRSLSPGNLCPALCLGKPDADGFWLQSPGGTPDYQRWQDQYRSLYQVFLLNISVYVNTVQRSGPGALWILSGKGKLILAVVCLRDFLGKLGVVLEIKDICWGCEARFGGDGFEAGTQRSRRPSGGLGTGSWVWRGMWRSGKGEFMGTVGFCSKSDFYFFQSCWRSP